MTWLFACLLVLAVAAILYAVHVYVFRPKDEANSARLLHELTWPWASAYYELRDVDDEQS